MKAQGLQERNYIHISPALVNAKYSLTKQESNIVLLLLTIIDKDDEDFKDYTFTKSDLEKRTGVKLNSLKLKNLAKGLMSKVLEVPTDKDNFELFTWFSYFKYENGVITCGFDKRLKKYLLELHQYILINAPQLLLMKSDYSRRIYMLLKERAKFGTRKFKVTELQDLLAVPSSYKGYSKFKQSVLTNAVKEINKHTDLEIEFEEKKPIRKVTEIIFSIKKNRNDLKAFIKIIREAYTNTPLYTNKGRTIQCSDKGLLYYADAPMEWIDKAQSQKIWEWLQEHRETLLCFKISTKDEDEIQKNIEKIILESS
jgi:plasmid replication initiation protein